MGRYVYQPIILRNAPDGYQEEEFIKNYFKSIKTGELLVDLRNYDIFVTEEGIELPIPVTRNLREIIIGFVKSLKGDFNTRYLYLLKYADRIARLKEQIDAKLEEIEQKTFILDGKIISKYNTVVYFENVTINNLNLLGQLSYTTSDYYKTLSERYEILREDFEALQKLEEDFNIENTKHSNNSTVLEEIYNRIQNVNKRISDFIEKNKLGTISGHINLSKQVGSIETVTMNYKLYDVAYMTLAGNPPQGSVEQRDLWFAGSHSYVGNLDKMDTMDLIDKGVDIRRKLLTNETLNDITYVNWERIYCQKDLNNGLSIDDCNFRNFGYSSTNLGYLPCWKTNKKKYVEQVGNCRWDIAKSGAILDPYKDITCYYDSVTEQWIPKIVKFAANGKDEEGNSLVCKKTSKITYCESPIVYDYDGTKYDLRSCTYSTTQPIPHPNYPHNTQGNFSAWRMIKMVLEGNATKTITKNSLKTYNEQLTLPLSDPKTFN